MHPPRCAQPGVGAYDVPSTISKQVCRRPTRAQQPPAPPCAGPGPSDDATTAPPLPPRSYDAQAGGVKFGTSTRDREAKVFISAEHEKGLYGTQRRVAACRGGASGGGQAAEWLCRPPPGNRRGMQPGCSRPTRPCPTLAWPLPCSCSPGPVTAHPASSMGRQMLSTKANAGSIGFGTSRRLEDHASEVPGPGGLAGGACAAAHSTPPGLPGANQPRQPCARRCLLRVKLLVVQRAGQGTGAAEGRRRRARRAGTALGSCCVGASDTNCTLD